VCLLRFQLHFNLLYAYSDKGLKGPNHAACIITQFCQTVMGCLFTKYRNHSRILSIQLTVPQLLTNFAHFMKPEGYLPYPQQHITCFHFKQNLLQELSSCLFKIHFNIILPSAARSSNCSLSFRFVSQNLNFTHKPIIRYYIYWTTEDIGNKTIVTYYFNNLHNVTV